MDDMSQWVRCPLGLAPGQTEISPTMFDLPASLDGPPIANSMTITTSESNTVIFLVDVMLVKVVLHAPKRCNFM